MATKKKATKKKATKKKATKKKATKKKATKKKATKKKAIRGGAIRSVAAFHEYLERGLAGEIWSCLTADHAEQWLVQYEGTLRAALWSVLRQRLPKSWYVEAEACYPESAKRTDVYVLCPRETRIAFEVKLLNDFEGVRRDLSKLVQQVRAGTIDRGYTVFPLFGDFDDLPGRLVEHVESEPVTLIPLEVPEYLLEWLVRYQAEFAAEDAR